MDEHDIRKIVREEINSAIIAAESRMKEYVDNRNCDNTSQRSNCDDTSQRDDSALMLSNNTLSLVVAEVSKLQVQIYEQVINNINETVLPVINHALTTINYKLGDDDVTVDAFRRCVEHQFNGFDPNVPMITDGRNDSRIISPFVRTVFRDDTTDSGSDDDAYNAKWTEDTTDVRYDNVEEGDYGSDNTS